MSILVEKYECICGGEITRSSQNGAVSLQCDSCNCPASGKAVRNYLVEQYLNQVNIVLADTVNGEEYFSINVPKLEFPKKPISEHMRDQIDFHFEVDFEKDLVEVTILEFFENKDSLICNIFINGSAVKSKDKHLLVKEPINKKHPYKNRAFTTSY